MSDRPGLAVNPLLSGSLVKLKRAKVHLGGLGQSIERYRTRQHYNLTQREKASGKLRIFTWDVRQAEPFPYYWPVLVGEVLYQINSALDHLAWHLALLRSAPDEPDRVTFPIYTSRQQFCRRNKDGLYRQGSGAWVLDRVPEAARPLLVEVQPYMRAKRPEKHPLALLFVLANEDKHKTLHFTRAGARARILRNPKVEHAKVVSFDIIRREPFDVQLDEFAALKVLLTGPRPRIEAEPGFLFEEVFGTGAPSAVAGEPVYETLKLILNYVITDVCTDRFIPFFDSLVDVGTDGSIQVVAPKS